MKTKKPIPFRPRRRTTSQPPRTIAEALQNSPLYRDYQKRYVVTIGDLPAKIYNRVGAEAAQRLGDRYGTTVTVRPVGASADVLDLDAYRASKKAATQ